MQTTPPPRSSGDARPDSYTPPRRRRRKLLVAGLGVLVLLAVLPWILSPLLPGLIEKELEKRVDADVSIGSLSVSWLGNARISDLALEEPSGMPLARVDQVQASLGVLGLLSGSYRARVEVQGLELHLRKDEQGIWNLSRVLKESAQPEEPAGDEPEREQELPSIHANVLLSGGHVVLHGSQGDTELTNLAFEANVEGLDRPAPFRLTTSISGPTGPAGEVELEGSVTAAADGELGIGGMLASTELELREIRLEGLEPALGLVAPLKEIDGTLGGSAAFQLERGLALTGSSSIQIRNVSFAGTRPEEPPVRIQSIALQANATLAASGAGEQALELTADDFLRVAYTGTSNVPSESDGEITGALTLDGSIGRLTEIARSWVPIREGVVLDGKLAQRFELSTKLRASKPTSVTLNARGGFEGLEALAADGQVIDLGELSGVRLDFDSSLDLERGELVISRLEVGAGPVELRAHLQATGLLGGDAAGELAIREGSFALDADLERLRADVAKIIDLGPSRFGGSLHAEGTLSGEPENIGLEGRLEARAFSLGDLSLEAAEGRVQARRAGERAFTIDGTMQLSELALAPVESDPLAIPRLELALSAKQADDGNGSGELRITTDEEGLSFVLTAETRPQEDQQTFTGGMTLRGRVAYLADLAPPGFPLQRGASGTIESTGEFSGRLVDLQPRDLEATLAFDVNDLATRAEDGASVTAFERIHAAVELAVDVPASVLDVRSLSVDAGVLRAGGKARVALPSESGKLEISGAHFQLDSNLGELGRSLAQVVDLGGLEIGGQDLHAEMALEMDDAGSIVTSGRVEAPEVLLVRADAPAIVQQDLTVTYELAYRASVGSLDCRSLAFGSRTGSVNAKGTLSDLSDPSRMSADLELDLTGELGRVLADLGLETLDSGRKTNGSVEGTFRVKGDRGSLGLTCQATIGDFRLEVTPPGEKSEPQAPLVIEEDAIVLASDVGLQGSDLRIKTLTLESKILRGGIQGNLLHAWNQAEGEGAQPTFEDLRGEFAYVPDRLGAVLAPWLPGTLSGSEEQRITFQLDGRVAELDVASLLASSTGTARVGIGRFVRPGVDVSGQIGIELEGGETRFDSDLQANGGTLAVQGILDLSPADDSTPGSRLNVNAKECRANPALAPLFSLVHPAFATAQLAQGQLEGVVDLTLDLAYDGPLTLEQLEAGWKDLPKEPIRGTGSFGLRSARLSGSPLLGLLEEFGVDTSKSLDLKPIVFSIERGRLSYDNPWTWTLSGVETTFTGSIGLDQTLDLTWNVPITEKLVERYDFLGVLQGQSIRVPLRGTAQKPKLEIDDVLKDLAAEVAKKELGSRLGLGGSGSGGGGNEKESDDPAALLEQADRLWSSGKKAEAAVIYQRLRDEFKLSLVYLMNKDRIKDRSKFKE